MTRTLSRKFITTILAASIVMTGFSAAPARADSDDVAKVAIGLAALFMIGKAIEDANGHTVYRAPQRRPQVHSRPHPSPLPHHGYTHQRPKPKPTPIPYARNRMYVPAQCLYAHDTWSGRITMLNRTCLQKSYRYSASLPASCRVQARTPKGMRRGFDPRCLRSKGYRLMQF